MATDDQVVPHQVRDVGEIIAGGVCHLARTAVGVASRPVWVASIAGLDRVVADDVRFANEAAAIRALGGTVVEIRRPGLSRLAGGHVSEAGVAADTVVDNDATAVGGLSRGLERLVGLGRADRDREGS